MFAHWLPVLPTNAMPLESPMNFTDKQLTKIALWVFLALICYIIVVALIGYANAAEVTIRRYETVPYSLDPQVQQYVQPNVKATHWTTGTAKSYDIEASPETGCPGFLVASGPDRGRCVEGQ